MSELPGYDAWKTRDPNEGACEFCGERHVNTSAGWRPSCCTGQCDIHWRDPDEEYERRRDDAHHR